MSSRGCAWLGAVLFCIMGLAQAVEVRVVDASDGRPVAGATAVAQGDSQVTGPDGIVSIAAHPMEPPTAMRVRAPGYARKEVVLEAKQAVVDVALRPIHPRAVYLSVQGVSNQALREAAVALQDDTAINALVIDMKGDRGDTPYPSAARIAAGAARAQGNDASRIRRFATLIQQLRARGLYLIARIVVFKDDRLAAAHPAWAVRDRNGDVWRDREDQRWIDPTVEAAWGNSLDVAEEAAKLGFDEIQFDYLRFPDAGGLQFQRPNTRANRVAAVTGLAEADIIKAAEWIGSASNWMSCWTMGLNQSIHGTWHTNAICNLHLATGAICRPGSGPFSLTGQPNAMGGREMGYMGPGLPGQRSALVAQQSCRSGG